MRDTHTSTVGGPDVCIVIPSFNEAENLPVLIGRIAAVLADFRWQAIIVDDDSPDASWKVAKALARVDARVECLRRVGRRGLAGAVIEGMLASAAPIVAVIDADLQHDETRLPLLLSPLLKDEADLAVATRYLEGETASAGLSAHRAAGSLWATRLARMALHTEISDPMSGFFAVRRDLVESIAPKLSTQGFKILFDLVATLPKPPRVVEVGYVFSDREAGESKMDYGVVIEFLGLLVTKATGNLVPPRAILFGAVGLSGLAVQLAGTKAALLAQVSFDYATIGGSVLAMTSNFALNNVITYRDRRLKGWRWISGYLRFSALCALPLMVNYTAAHWVFAHDHVWWVAGVAGALLGAVWNYVSTAAAVW